MKKLLSLISEFSFAFFFGTCLGIGFAFALMIKTSTYEMGYNAGCSDTRQNIHHVIDSLSLIHQNHQKP